jgi:hypothetical protein
MNGILVMQLRIKWPTAAALAAAGLLVLSQLSGCSSAVQPRQPLPVSQSPWALAFAAGPMAEAPEQPAYEWQHFRFPGKDATVFRYTHVDGRDAVAAQAEASASSMLRHRVRVEPATLGRIAFSWKVPAPTAGVQAAGREDDDSAVRVLLSFDGDRSRLSAKNSMLSELSRVLMGEEMPFATLMYVWSQQRPIDSVIMSPRTDRIRKIVVESGAARLDHWLDYERDIRADYIRAFGEPPGALVDIAIMTDADSDKQRVEAWYGPVRLKPVLLSNE